MSTISRRTFLGVSSLAISGQALGLPSLYTQKKSLGVALLGLGSYSTYQLAPALQLTQHCNLAGIITGSPEKIPKWQKQYGIKDRNVYSYDTMNRIANNEEIDIIYVVTPTGTHADFTIAAARTGKHVWCEKPMAMDVEECQRMIDECRKNKVQLTIGYRVQHEPNTLKFNSYTDTLPFGKILNADAAAGYRGGGGTGWRFQKEMGGGALYDMGVYTVNGLRNALKMEPVKVIEAARTTKRPKIFHEVDETTEYLLEFPGSIAAKGKTSVGENMNHLRITAEKGWYEMRPMQTYNGVQGSRSDGVRLNQPVKNQQALQMDDDALALKENKEMPVDPIEGLRDIRVIEAINKSADTGQPIEI